MITKDQFIRYYKVLNEGKYDMINEAAEAMAAANLNEKDYNKLLMNYSDYYNEYIDQI